MDIVTLAAAMAYTKKTADALGAVKGAPCTIQGITDIEGGHRITFAWTSASGNVETSSLDVMNGKQGQQGEPGQPGAHGLPGNDGISPAVTITDIPGGHRVTITDAAHPEGQSFDVMDGKGGSDAKVFVAEYNVTTAQEIIAYLNAAEEPFAPILIKRGSDYYTCITAQKQADNKVIIRSFATLSGNYYVFTYTVTNGTWASASNGFQPLLESGTNIKTINGESLLGGGNIDIHGGGGNASFDVATIPQGQTGNNEVNAVTSNGDSENARLSYIRQADGTLPSTVNLGVKFGLGEDSFELTTPAYVNLRSAFTIVQNTTTPQEIWNAINLGRALMFRTAAGITKSVLSASAGVAAASFICATDSGEGFVVWSVDSNAAYTPAATIFATEAYVLSQVTPKAEIEINESTNAMDITGGGRYASFNVNTDGDLEMNLAEPGVYLKTATVPSKTNVDNAISAGVTEAKAYTDNKTLAASGWGVVRTGVATVTFNNSKWSSSATVDVSELGFSSGADYDVVAQPTTGGTATPWGNAIAYVNADKGASSFSVSSVTMEEILSGTVNVKYTIFAKGYGAVAYTGEIPTGGTAGQVLTKRSDADGDYGWQNKLPSYVADKPEGSTPVSGNVVQVGSFTNTDGTEYGIYEFYYKTSALPAADTTKTYSFSPLLDDYTIFDFIDQSGITSNGHVISSGRTDGTNRIIIQQFSKNNKNVMLRAYGDYTEQTALLRIKFIGTKNV